MALSLVTNLLTSLQPLVEKEVGLLLGVDEEMTKLQSTPSTIEAVLEDAERNHPEDKAVQDWLRKLKGAAYEVDDILDECSTEILRWESKGQSSGSLKKVVKLAAIADERNKFHFRNMVVENRDEFTKSRETGSLLTLPKLTGRDRDKEKISIKVLLEDALERNEVSVYPIIGMGGLGKTTLAQAAFNDERMKSHFDLMIWVYVSQDFDLKRVVQSISGDTCQLSDLDSLQKKLRERLNGKRYLIVLDDVWDEDQEKWDKLKYTIACGSKGSSIIVTTRVEKVAAIMGTLPTHCLSYLSEEDCWLLFKQRAFGNSNEERSNLVAIGKDIVKKCGGVPLAATALGGLLRFQREESKWLSIKESEIWNLPQDGNPILPALRLSYYNLPLEFRRCFAYCAYFPKGSEIEKGNLIRLWMANGYISRKDKLEPEDLGDHIWTELCWRSFFQRLDKPETETDRWLTSKDCDEDYKCKIWFKMHDLVHDLAQYIVEDERHMMEYRGSSDTSDRKVREVSTRMLREGDQATYSPFQPDNCDFRKFGSLRVFEASGIEIMKLLSSIDKLKHLRYFDISDSEINHLPNSICTLWNLQTLILDRCKRLKRLPNNMKCLRNLRHLHLSSCFLMEMPPEIGQLTCLKELSLFVVGKNKDDKLPLECRRCFAYCAFFPKGSEIEKGNLIQLWMANGYISCKDKQEPEDLGDDIWSELCWRSFFQRLDKPKTETYKWLTSKDCEEDYKCQIWFKMHDLVHDLAQYIVKDERHMMEYGGSSDKEDRKVREVSTRMLREGDQATYSPFQPDKCDFSKFGSLRVFEASGIEIMKLPS
ncbi:hypothetical protein RHMOL_Rhmol05G0016300 [Rhododendron molle]|uniref:Uncharacterized protein n=1 Tax=Rhododendron molle TaxID=49168 RepID=A0ACC0NKM7_RHOML|nr:hypothetical protein RHMOL_Rhmol05G0016300 [Rhododendron molle]